MFELKPVAVLPGLQGCFAAFTGLKTGRYTAILKTGNLRVILSITKIQKTSDRTVIFCDLVDERMQKCISRKGPKKQDAKNRKEMQ